MQAAAVRLFNEGRTETIRSNTSKGREFVKLMSDPKASNKDRVRIFTGFRGIDEHDIPLVNSYAKCLKYARHTAEVPKKRFVS